MKIKSPFAFFLIVFLSSCEYSIETYKEGKISYNFQCAPCHGINGEGLGTLYPNLLHLDYLKENREYICCWIHKGIGPDSTNAKFTRFSDQAMPANQKLSAIEMCNILNYLNARFWKMELFNIQEINEQLKVCENSKNETLLPTRVK